MSDITDQIATDLESIFDTDEFAIEVAYTPVDGALLNIAVMKQNEKIISDDSGTVRTAELFVRETDVSEPGYRDSVVISGIQWYVFELLDKSIGLWKLLIVREIRGNFAEIRGRF